MVSMAFLIIVLIVVIAAVAYFPTEATQILLAGSWVVLALAALGSIVYALTTL